MDRVELETKLNDGRNWLLARYQGLSEEELRRPLIKSEHDSQNQWSALDHFAHLALVERNFNAMVKRHFAGNSNPVGFMIDDQGKTRTREEITADVHADTEKWRVTRRDDSSEEVLALTAAARGATLQLMAELNDTQLVEILPKAPWADGAIAGVLGANADHG